MIYNLVTCRPNKFNLERLAITQRNMVRRMLRLKRHPICAEPPVLEPWLDWQKRSLRTARAAIYRNSACIVATLDNERSQWAGHISRFGWDTRPEHILQHLLLWRNSWWWDWQMFYNSVGSPFTKLSHDIRTGDLRRWEWQLKRSWILDNTNRNSTVSQGSHSLPR